MKIQKGLELEIQYGLQIYSILQEISKLFPVEQLHLEIKVENPGKLLDSIPEFNMQGYKIPTYFLDLILKRIPK